MPSADYISPLERMDIALASFLSDWNIITTILAIILAVFVAYPILFPSEPDTHPLLLARQSAIDQIRNKNESAIYCSPEVPADTPLRSGLAIKDPSAPKWSAGKDGDLRDVWREVMRGGKQGVKEDVPRGRIMTVLGKDELVEHEDEQLTKEIAIMGKHMKDAGVTKVAIYLPNCAEYLMTVFGVLCSTICECFGCILMYSSMLVLWIDANITAVQLTTSEDIRATQSHFYGWLDLCCWKYTT
jgi:hypothetical protein